MQKLCKRVLIITRAHARPRFLSAFSFGGTKTGFFRTSANLCSVVLEHESVSVWCYVAPKWGFFYSLRHIILQTKHLEKPKTGVKINFSIFYRKTVVKNGSQN